MTTSMSSEALINCKKDIQKMKVKKRQNKNIKLQKKIINPFAKPFAFFSLFDRPTYKIFIE